MASLGAAIVLHGAAAGWPAGQDSDAAEADGRRVIEVIARRYSFEPEVIEVRAGEPVRLLVRSADGVHGFAIDKLDVKREIPRGGKAVAIDFVASQAGRFQVACSEYCGNGHEEMKGTLVVHAAVSAEPPSQER